MNRFTIFLDGELQPGLRLQRQIMHTRCIAADGGMRHALACEVIPELWIGDFDSSTQDTQDLLKHVPTLRLPLDKDKTDAELAAEECVRRGAGFILFAGAFGGSRIDHILFHFSLALRLARQNISSLLSSGQQEGVVLLPGIHVFDYTPNTLFSLLPFTDLENVHITGAHWPLEGFDVSCHFSRTLSNRVSGTLRISFDSGSAVLIAFPEDA